MMTLQSVCAMLYADGHKDEAKAIQQLREENERLREENAKLSQDYTVEHNEALLEIERLREQTERQARAILRLEKDAERYRFLRYPGFSNVAIVNGSLDPLEGEAANRAIDAAMGEDK